MYTHYQLHPSLRQCISASWSASSNIIWDMRADPHNPPPRISLFPKYYIHPAIYHEPATFPLTHKLAIVYQTSKLDSHAVDVYNQGFVAVGDVINTLYRHLREPISHREWGSFSSFKRDKISAAFYDRCHRASRAQYEYSRGVRRIDLLRGRTMFRGLTYEGCGTFRLLMGK